MKRHAALASALIIALSSFASCSAAKDPAAEGLTYTDSTGETVVFESVPQKVVCIAPAVTEIIFAIGAGETLAGSCQYCDYPQAAASSVKVGGMNDFNSEQIIQLAPDVVFVNGRTALENASLLKEAGIKVVCFETYEDPDAIYRCITDIGLIMGKQDSAAALIAGLKERYAALTAVTSAAGFEKKTVFVDLWGFWSSNRDFLLGKNLNLIAVNIAFDEPSGQLSPEFIIQSDPDVYICLEPEADFRSHMPAGFSEMKAFKTGQVYFLASDDPRTGAVTRQGPRFVDGLEILYGLVYGEKP